MTRLSEMIISLPDVDAENIETVMQELGADRDITGISMRLDDVQPGFMFCCINGSTFDGHDNAALAIDKGAVALLVERSLDVRDDVAQIVVESARATMGIFSDVFFGHPTASLPVYGITGTNGKTTTTHLLASILEVAGLKPGMIGTIGTKIGKKLVDNSFTTPEAVDLQNIFGEMIAAGNQSCAMEVSSHALSQGRVSGVRFAAVGFSNLTRDHLDYHRSFEAYFQAKRLLFVTPGPEGQHWPAAVNCDDEWGCRLFDELVHVDRGGVPVWGYTLDGMNRASVSAEYKLTPKGARIDVESPVGDFSVRSKLRGRFNVENVLTAATMALVSGIEIEHVIKGIERVKGVRGRFEPIDSGQNFQVFVDYAHTPDSLEQVLRSARDITDGRVIVVFGCGGDRDRSKRPLMGRVAAQLADVAVITSDNPRTEDPEAIISEIAKGIKRGEFQIEADRREAIFQAVSMAESSDVVVIAGKGHEQGQRFADETHPFDDADVVREAIASCVVS